MHRLCSDLFFEKLTTDRQHPQTVHLCPACRRLCVDGDRAETAVPLLFDHILFTGSTEVGKKVAEAAARNLTPVTLELGGKSPVVIERGFFMKRAAFGKLTNGGQTCIAPDYALIHEDEQEAFAATYQEAVKKLHPSDFVESPDYTAMRNQHPYERLSGLVRDAEGQ